VSINEKEVIDMFDWLLELFAPDLVFRAPPPQ